jgi:hypothetical protein
LSLPTTVGLLMLALGLTAFFGWRGARAPDLRKGPRMAPWRFLMLLAAALAVMLMVHLVNLMGVTTGRP